MNVHGSFIPKSLRVETTQVSIDGWKDKQNIIFIYIWDLYMIAYMISYVNIYLHAMEYYSAIKKEGESDSTAWMNLEVILSKRDKS